MSNLVLHRGRNESSAGSQLPRALAQLCQALPPAVATVLQAFRDRKGSGVFAGFYCKVETPNSTDRRWQSSFAGFVSGQDGVLEPGRAIAQAQYQVWSSK